MTVKNRECYIRFLTPGTNFVAKRSAIGYRPRGSSDPSDAKTGSYSVIYGNVCSNQIIIASLLLSFNHVLIRL